MPETQYAQNLTTTLATMLGRVPAHAHDEVMFAGGAMPFDGVPYFDPSHKDDVAVTFPIDRASAAAWT
jgi:hypothetical protein